MNSSSKKIKANTLKSIEKFKSNLTTSNINELACNLKYLKELLNRDDCNNTSKFTINNIIDNLKIENPSISGLIEDYIKNIEIDSDINKEDITKIFKNNKNIAEILIKKINDYKICEA